MVGSFNKAYNDINKTINNMSKLVMEQEIAKAIYIYSKPSSYELRELKHKVKMLEELYRNKLNGEQYIRLLINTKIVENNVFSSICNYTLDDLFGIIDYSGWDLSETNKFYVDTDDEEIKRDSYYNFLEASKVVDNQFDYHFLKKL